MRDKWCDARKMQRNGAVVRPPRFVAFSVFSIRGCSRRRIHASPLLLASAIPPQNVSASPRLLHGTHRPAGSANLHRCRELCPSKPPTPSRPPRTTRSAQRPRKSVRLRGDIIAVISRIVDISGRLGLLLVGLFVGRRRVIGENRAITVGRRRRRGKIRRLDGVHRTISSFARVCAVFYRGAPTSCCVSKMHVFLESVRWGVRNGIVIKTEYVKIVVEKSPKFLLNRIRISQSFRRG